MDSYQNSDQKYHQNQYFHPPVALQPMQHGDQGFVVPIQPAGITPRPVEHGILNCPPGLEYLAQIGQLFVNQKVEILEVITGFETQNEYVVQNSTGQNIYMAKEESNCCARNMLGPIRSFDLILKDYAGNELIHVERPLRCDSCLFPCCLQEIEVSSPPGNVIGKVKQKWSLLKPKFDILNDRGDVVLKIKGPFITFGTCFTDVVFEVLSKDGSIEVGKISKKWSDFIQEAFTDADIFAISFPVDLDVKVKATLLGALFLIDFMYFEKQQNN